MDSTILGASISSLIRDHFPFALCHACAAQRLNVSVFDFRNAAQAVAVQADFAITRRACSGCGSVADLLALTPEAAGAESREVVTDDASLRVLIRRKMADGRLPRDAMSRVWGGNGNEAACTACEETISKHQVAMEGMYWGKTTTLHVRCFSLWDQERRVKG